MGTRLTVFDQKGGALAHAKLLEELLSSGFLEKRERQEKRLTCLSKKGASPLLYPQIRAAEKRFPSRGSAFRQPAND